MRKKGWKKRAASIALAAAMVVSSLTMNPFAGIEVVKAAEVMPENVKLSDYDLWKDGAKWTSKPTDGNSWTLSSNKLYTYSDDKEINTQSLPSTSVAGINFCDDGTGEGSSFKYCETVAVLPRGTYTLSTMLMGSSANITLFIGNDTAATSYSAIEWNEWVLASNTFTVTEDRENVEIGYYLETAKSGWGYIDQLYITGTSLPTEPGDITNTIIKNGDFENGIENWTLSDSLIINYK